MTQTAKNYADALYELARDEGLDERVMQELTGVNALFAANPGGAPCNVLAMLTKLGHSTAFIGKVGNDMGIDGNGNLMSSKESGQDLYYTVNGVPVYNKGSIDFYTKAQIDTKIQKIYEYIIFLCTFAKRNK